ncbi:replication factor A protein 2, partial [Rhizophlyctis rosea]
MMGSNAYGGYGGYGGVSGGNNSNNNNNPMGGGGYGGYGAMQNDNAGGGGFLSPQPGALGSQGDSPKKRFGNNQQTLRPVTIKQLLEAKATIPDAPFRIDGHDIAHVTIVGRLNTINRLATSTSYIIDDGTGAVEARKWLEATESDDFNAQADDGLREGMYVRVTGHFREFKNKRSVVAFNTRVVDNMDEITYHNLHCMLVHLHLTKGPL